MNIRKILFVLKNAVIYALYLFERSNKNYNHFGI